MKTRMTFLAVACCVGAAWGQPPSPAPKPDPGYRTYEVWLGDWQYEGEAKDSPLGPGGKFSGRAAVRWILDGFFLEWRSWDKGPGGDSETIEFDWYDTTTKNYLFQGYVSNGDMYSAVATVKGNVWNDTRTYTHKGVQYKLRQVTTFTADGMSEAWKTEISTDAKTWAVLNEGKATKVASASVEQELIKLEDGWAQAMVKRDVAFLDRVLAEEFTFTDPEGTVRTKAQYLAGFKSGENVATSARQDAVKVRIYGEVAVVTGLCIEKSQSNGKDTSGQYQWTDTLIKRDGRWQCVATQASKVVGK